MSNLFRLCGAIGVVFALLACGQSGSTQTPAAPAGQADGTASDTPSHPVATAKPSKALWSGWQSYAPGGETTCSDGTPYRFFVRPGDPEKLLVYLQGGGACWFRQNCDPQMQPTYSINIADNFKPAGTGIFNFNNADNPFADYSVVMAPYCTGDVHLGDTDTIYPPVEEGQTPLTIHHRGYTNMQAVLNWTYTNVPAPQEIFVTGSSAGAIPSPYYAAMIADHYPAARVAQLGDGAGGYRRLTTDARPNDQWDTYSFLTRSRGFEALQAENFNYEALYIAAANAHPDVLFAEYDAAEDAVQKRFLALGGSEVPALLDALQANHTDIRAAADNFRAFIGGGDSHTILLRPEFYSYAANGVSILDWVTDLSQRTPVADITCQQCDTVSYAGPTLPANMTALWASWEDRETQYVEPFQIFDNVYYVGIDWVAAYVIKTSEGLILVDSLYGSWVRPLMQNMRRLGLNPADVKYVINTHGHFDHAGGSALFQQQFGAKVVMTEEDWQLAEAKPDLPMFYMPVPTRDIVAEDGDVIELGDTRITLYKTPGHTEGVLTLRYAVRDGDATHTAVTLGGVGLNFSGVQRTEQYLDSYARLVAMQQAEGVSVSLPNHAAMGRVFERAALLKQRQAGAPHPFVDAPGYKASLAEFIANAGEKLEQEKAGNAQDPLAELTQAISSDSHVAGNASKAQDATDGEQ